MDNFREFLIKKSFEVSYSLFRVANATEKSPELVILLKNKALNLLDAASSCNYGEMELVLKSLKYFLMLGVEDGAISDRNYRIITNESDNLNMAIIAALEKSTDIDGDPDLSKIFSPTEKSKKVEGDDGVLASNDYVSSNADNMENDSVETIERKDEEESLGTKSNKDGFIRLGDYFGNPATIAGYTAKMRQLAILNKVKKEDQCQLKDIQRLLPESSERTLRYDLQKLSEDGLIERIGSGGPSSFYKLTEKASNSS